MKRLISLIYSALVFAGCATTPKIVSEPKSQEEIFRNLGIPVRFVGYEKSEAKKQLLDIEGRLVGIKDFDLNSDGRKEVREFYKINAKDEMIGEYLSTKPPFSYAFDLDKNGRFSEDEILMDDHEDGLNGDERWYLIKIVKIASDNI
jgi:hypothetical protein